MTTITAIEYAVEAWGALNVLATGYFAIRFVFNGRL